MLFLLMLEKLLRPAPLRAKTPLWIKVFVALVALLLLLMTQCFQTHG